MDIPHEFFYERIYLCNLYDAFKNYRNGAIPAFGKQAQHDADAVRTSDDEAVHIPKERTADNENHTKLVKTRHSDE